MVSPMRTITAPSACLARRPVSIERVWEPRDRSRLCITGLRFGWMRPDLLTDTEALDDLSVTVDVLALQVIEQPPALANELQQPAPRMVILAVGLEVLGQVVDAFAENRDLNFWGAGVFVVLLVVADD